MSEIQGGANSFFQRARKLQREGRLEEAIALYKEAIEKNPNFAWYYHDLGEALTAVGDGEGAIAAFSEAVKLNSNSSYFQERLDYVQGSGKTPNFYSDSQLRHFFQTNSHSRSQNQQNLKKQWIIVDFVRPSQKRLDIPDSIMRILIPAKYLQKVYGYGILAWIKPDYHEIKSFLSSFGIENFIYLEDKKISLTQEQLYDLKQFQSTANDLNYKELLKSFTSKKLHIGDLMYDYLLKIYRLSTPILDSRIFKTLERGSLQMNYWEKILNNFDIKYVILGHTVQFRGILARLAAKNGITVFGVSSGWLFRRYDSLDELYDCSSFISQELFEYFWNYHKEKALKIGKELLHNQIGIKQTSHELLCTSVTYDSQAYAKEKKIYTRQEICYQLGLDSSLPIVIIASHVFNDAPHSYRHRIFVDYYEWLLETLKICSKIDSINWIVKEHPYVGNKQRNYNVERTAKKLVNDSCNKFSNIKIAPDNLSNISLIDFCHAIVTVSGTISHELGCFGIPSILSGASSFSSCGFTNNAQTFEEYKQMLYSINEIPKLSREQVEKAYVAYAILFHFTTIKSDFNLINFSGDFSSALEYLVQNKGMNYLSVQNIQEDYFVRCFDIQLMLRHKLSLRYNELIALI